MIVQVSSGFGGPSTFDAVASSSIDSRLAPWRLVNQLLSGTSSMVFTFCASTNTGNGGSPKMWKIWLTRSYRSLSSISLGSSVTSINRSSSSRSGSLW